MSEFIVITIKLKIPQRTSDQSGRCTVKFGDLFSKEAKIEEGLFVCCLLPKNPTFSMAIFYGVRLTTQF